MRRISRQFTLAALSLVCIVMLVGCCSSNTPVLRYITISPTSQSTPVGTPVTFTATAYYSNGSTAPATALVTWASSNTSVATVSGGICDPLSAGSTTISASAAGTPGASATLTVTQSTTVTSIAVTPVNPTVPLGGSQQFDAVATYSDESTKDVTSTATWSSGNTGAATISATGLASVPTTATVDAASVITASFSGVNGTTTPTVGAAVAASLRLTTTPGTPTIAIGNSITILAQEVYTDGSLHTPANVVVWANGTAATAGLVTLTANNSETSIASGFAKGTTTITATDGSFNASVTVTVVTGSTHYAYVSNIGDGTIEWYSAATTSPYLTASPAFPGNTFSTKAGSTQTVISPNGLFLYYTDTAIMINAATVNPSSGALAAPTGTPVNGASFRCQPLQAETPRLEQSIPTDASFMWPTRAQRVRRQIPV